ncbi:HAMP domain-containing sensor histidine kinase [Pseudonocardia sp. NPDC046786]|uniref:sensor histidine kinase n=1 Tax=Pseudonocardia sp. NPDC046786 TaxID=3155471 RepID=UPI0033CA9E68
MQTDDRGGPFGRLDPAFVRTLRDLGCTAIVVGLPALLGLLLTDRAPAPVLTVLLALLAASACAAAALLIVTAGDARLAWIGWALACYGLVAVPTGLVGAIDFVPGPTVSGVVLLALTVGVGALAAATTSVPPPAGASVIAAAAVAAVLVALVVRLGVMFPMAVQAVTAFRPLVFVVAVALAGIGVLVASRARDRFGWMIGAGLATVGAAHVVMAAGQGVPLLGGGLIFSLLRTAGAVVIAVGAALLVWGAVRGLDDQRAEREEELRLAEIRLARAAERDHELRNGIAGLAGAADLLGTQQDPQSALLETVVVSELRRLDDLLRSPIDVPRRPGPAAYAVTPVLRGLAALRRTSGMDIDTDVAPDLRAIGSPSLLAQVITNLLANAARHAPGSPVLVRGLVREGTVIIEVSDSGPGLPPGAESEVFDRGVRANSGTGLGLGLHICRELLADQGGTISIGPADGRRPGCTVTVMLPAAPTTVASKVPDSVAVGRCIA